MRTAAKREKTGGSLCHDLQGNTAHLLDRMVTCGADLFNVDHIVPLITAKETYAAWNKCFKGNLDPVADMMQTTPEQCYARAYKCLEETRNAAYMLSAGCEVPAATSDEVFRAFCEAPEILAEDLREGLHRVEITLCRDSNPESNGREFMICGIMVS